MQLEIKISESACQILCSQETKRDHFYPFYIKKFCPRSLDKFAWSPSDGASSGLLTVWNSSFFMEIWYMLIPLIEKTPVATLYL